MSSTQKNQQKMLSLASLRTLQKGRETNTALSHNFGTLTIQAGKCGILHNQVTLGYNVDRSGSMSTRAKDGRTKLEHATYTLEQMVHYLQEDRSMAACTARVGVNAFDHQNTPLAVAQGLGLHRCKDNMWASLGEEEERKKLLSSLGALRTRGSTDIGGACALIKEEFGSLGPAQPAEHRAHILLTDGLPNQGPETAEGIFACCPTGCDNYFIGYGADHDGMLLQRLAALTGGQYHFVDSFENAGMVYGEILHGILFKAATEVILRIEGAELYDFRTNKWCDELSLPDFASEQSRTFHFRFSWEQASPLRVLCSYKSLGDADESPRESLSATSWEYNHHETVSEDTRDGEVHKYWYRQQTLELLHEAREACIALLRTEPKIGADGDDLLKTKLETFLEAMKEFMKKTGLEQDEFMMKLCDDIFVAHSSVGVKYGGLKYVTSRQASQGEERCYTVCDLSLLGLGCGARSPPALRRANAGTPPMPVLRHEMSQNIAACYTSPMQASLMKAVSCPADGASAHGRASAHGLSRVKKGFSMEQFSEEFEKVLE